MSSDTARPAAEPALRLRYAPSERAYDEMLAGPDQPREHWNTFVRAVEGLGPNALARRWDEARRLLHENGVTYNVYGDPRGVERPWELDPLPLVLDGDAWRSLEAALAQRALLLNLILADLYGRQRLLREGLYPPELVFAHPGYLRPCHGLEVPQGCWLSLHAADVARAPDGTWRALADRTQAPSGAGYALENRLVLRQMLPEPFRDCRVVRLASFFRTLRETLRGLAPRHRENPRIVLLTPGPYNETYFEHAYLARYLGFALVEGNDLTVRDRAVFLKTLGGLQPVDVILRRLDDDFCDPLSLRADSSLGVPGLVEAVRAGTVTVANALGSGLVETPALMAFLPQLCRRLLGEELTLASVPTWWCGTPDGLAHVEANLERLVVKPAFPGGGQEAVFGAALTAVGREALRVRLRARPYAWVAQEEMPLSTAPVWTGGGVEPRPIVLRTFLVASDGRYEAMAGGLTRVAPQAGSLVVSMQRGGGSKDTWIRSHGPVPPVTLLRPAGAPIELTRGGSELPSRVADDLFWLGRYTERAESQARLLRAILSRLGDESGAGAEVMTLVDAYAEQARIAPSFAYEASGDGPRLSERALVSAAFEPPRGRSVRAAVAAAQRLGAVVRDQISLDTWRTLGLLERDVAQLASGGPFAPGVALSVLNRLVLGLASFSGLAMESMTRGQGWRFADMGRRIERALHTAGLLRATLARPRDTEAPLLDALLDVLDLGITYRRRYLGALELIPVLDLVLLDETSPRSVAFQLVELEKHVGQLPRDETRATRSAEERLALTSTTRLRLADVGALATVDPSGRRAHLAGLLSALDQDLLALSDAITRSYLSHAETSRPIGGGG